MSTSKKDEVEPSDVKVTSELLTVYLSDGRIVSVPTSWFPRLAHGKPAEWKNFELMPDGVHWPDLNEDIPVEGLLNGERSGESLRSINRWLELRRQGKKEVIEHLPLPPDVAAKLRRLGVIDGPADNKRSASTPFRRIRTSTHAKTLGSK